MSGRAAEGATAALRRALRRGSTSFTFLPVEVEGSRRAELIQALRGWSGHEGLPTLNVLPFGSAGAEAVEQLVRGARGARDGVVVPDGDALVSFDGGRVVEGLNLARDLLPRYVRGPLVVLCSPEAMAAFATAAPDLFSIRSAALHLSAEHGTAEGVSLPLRIEPTHALLPMRESLSSIEAEAARLEALAGRADAPSAGTLVDAWLLLARRVNRVASSTPGERLRRLALTRRCIGAAEHLAESVGYRSGVAEALEARALYNSGLTMSDRRAAIERAIAIYEELGLRREAASSRGSLGQILYNDFQRHEEGIALMRQSVAQLDQSGDEPWRGDSAKILSEFLVGVGRIDEALAVLREVALPAFEQTSDRRDVLQIRSMVALYEGGRGDTLAALDVMDRDILPAVREFGDERLLAEVLSDAADLHLRAGNVLDRQTGIRLLEEARLVAKRCEHGGVLRSIPRLEQLYGLVPAPRLTTPQNRRERRAHSRRSNAR